LGEAKKRGGGRIIRKRGREKGRGRFRSFANGKKKGWPLVEGEEDPKD